MVEGIVITFGGGMGSDGLAFRERFAGMVILFWPVAARFRMSEAAEWMNLWPSSQKGRTNLST
jgi:hypothetical protein